MADRNKRNMKAKGNHRRRTKKRRREFNAVMRLAAVMVCLLVAAVVILIVAPRRSHTVIINHPQPERRPAATQAPMPTLTAEAATPTPKPTQAPTATAEPVAQSAQAALTAAEALGLPAGQTVQTLSAVSTQQRGEIGESGYEYLPVYKRAETLERKIAITVDDCFQVNNLQTIARTAYQNGGKLTIFPIGENFSLSGMRDTLQGCAFKLGFEIENHTWSHSRVFRLSEQEMAEQIWKQSEGLNELLGVNYEQHFFRLMGGDGSSDQRTHNYLRQLGYKGIAEWSVSGSDSTLESIEKQLSPGQIYLFHTTDGDTQKLLKFIPYAVSQGYQLVTLNELLGFPENAVTEYSPRTMPEPQAYEDEYRTHKLGDYAWNIVRIQDKLRSLGLLNMDGPSTGYFGQQTTDAVAAFQKSAGIEATGVADSLTQRLLLDA